MTAYVSPFLPCEPKLQWRWIDLNGNRHPNLSKYLTLEQVQNAATPPLDLGKLWIPRTKWNYVVDDNTDGSGWEYLEIFSLIINEVLYLEN